MAITLTLGIIVPLTKGIIYLNAWAIVYYSVTGSPEPLDNNDNSSHAFSIYLIITAYFWETVSTRYKIMKWLTIIIVAAIIAGILGALNSKDGEKGEGFFSGALAGGMGCGYVIFEIFLVVGGLILLFKLFGFLFG